MAAFLQFVGSASRPPLWLDDGDYAAALLAGGKAPWLNVGAAVAWRRQSQNLLKPNVVALPLGKVWTHWLQEDLSLHAAMGAKTRTNFPLKTLLASTGLRGLVSELLAGLRSSFPTAPLALVCPSPRAWVADAYTATFAKVGDVGEDEVDAATLHCADFLREFGASGIDTVLLEESLHSEPSATSEVEWYRSVLNVAGHFRWDMGLHVPGVRFHDALPEGMAYLITPLSTTAPCLGQNVAPEFWSGAPLPALAPANFRFATVPLDLPPETILDRLEQLR